MNQSEDTLISDPSAQSIQQSLVMDSVEELRHVDVDRPSVAFLKVSARLRYGGARSSAWTETVAAVMKVRFEQRL
jgi:hypothetical protein